MEITVFGAGYVGLVSAASFAEIGHTVTCIDTDLNKIAFLQQGICPIYETGLQSLLDKHLEKNLFFSSDSSLCKNTELSMIAVSTPLQGDGEINLEYVYQVSIQIAKHLQQPSTIVLKSTVPPGTASKLTAFINKILQQRQCNFLIDVASNPEFLQESSAVQQFMYPDRIIIGAEKIQTIQVLHDLYQPIFKEKNQLLIMDKASAELTKYAANAFLATKISFMNEISQIAEAVGANINLVKNGVGLDYRINPLFLNAGCGFGGSCFPKDVLTLISIAQQHKIKPSVLEAVIKRNFSQQQLLFYKVSTYLEHVLTNKIIALWGLTFKPNTDDVRHATSLIIVDLFIKSGARIRAYDPMGMENFAAYYPDHPAIEYCSSALDTLEQADVLVITTEWREFLEIPLGEIKTRLNYPAIFDGRNVINQEQAHQQQLDYFGIGLGDNYKLAEKLSEVA